jgi:hypothetical protein
MKTLRQPQMIQRVSTVLATHGRKTRRRKPAAQDLRRRLANPIEAGLPGAVVKREHQQNPALPRGGAICSPIRADLSGYLGVSWSRQSQDGESQRKPQPSTSGHLSNQP